MDGRRKMTATRAAIVMTVVVVGTLAVGVALASALGWAQAPADEDIPPIASSRVVEPAFDASATETAPATVETVTPAPGGPASDDEGDSQSTARPDDDDADDDREVVRPRVRDSDDDERDEVEEEHDVEIEVEDELGVEVEDESESGDDEAHEVEIEEVR